VDRFGLGEGLGFEDRCALLVDHADAGHLQQFVETRIELCRSSFLPVEDIPGRKLPASPGAEPQLRHLNLHCFRSLPHAREEIGRQRRRYNTRRPHSQLGYL
jgi:transposase InsO family protein